MMQTEVERPRVDHDYRQTRDMYPLYSLSTCLSVCHQMGPGASEALNRYMELRKEMPFFANARTVRNAIDLARMKGAIRIFNEKTVQQQVEKSRRDVF